MQSIKKLFFTTIALTLTSFLMKTVAVWFNVYLTSLVGTVGMGIFQLIMTVYALSKTLAYGGMNLSATRLCIDDFEHTRHSMRRLLLVALSLGLFAAAVLFYLSDFLSFVWIRTESATLSLKILSFSLPFVSLSAALNGYMTAARKMSRYSVIQLTEQLVKIGMTVFFIGVNKTLSTELAIAKVCHAITVSEVVSFSMAMLSYLSDVHREKMKTDGKKGFIKRMTRLAVPDALGAYIRSGLNTLEHLLIPIGIRKSGASSDRAFSDYGIVQGMALPVILYPSSILGVLSGLLVPEIAECKVKNNKIQQNYIINRVLHAAIIFSMITTAVMLVFSQELSLIIYRSKEAAYFIALIAPLIPVMYLDMTTDGMLKGLDMQLDIMKINILDSVLCVLLVFILVPKIAVDGYIITIYVAEIINFLCSFYKLGKASSLRLGWMKNFLKPLTCSFLACTIARAMLKNIVTLPLGLTLSITLAVLLYFIFLRICKGINSEEVSWFLRIIRRKRKGADLL
ncbi:MAG: polysaccharide biosynthesis C-terminal domain-containing protein [Clostridia bacterium]|nr:polysaccharide biosynthesis C-terminal domain-containing protein [Clostridia bacterium]